MTGTLDQEALDIAIAPGEGTRSAPGSFSTANRTVQCLGSTVLPRVRDAEASEPAITGQAIHDFFKHAAAHGRERALAMASDKHVEILAAFDLTRLPTVTSGGYDHEVALAYDALEDKARLIGYDIGRNYGELADGEIPGTLDVLGLTLDGRAVVVKDYKSGRVAVPKPGANWQLKLGALAACRVSKRNHAFLGIIHTPPGRKPWTEYGEMDAFALEEAAELWREIVLRRRQLMKSFRQRGYAGLGDSLVMGAECRYCPSAPLCPAMTSHVRAVAGNPDSFYSGTVELLSAEQVGLARERLVELKGAVELLDEQIRACVTARPAVMRSGKFYGPTTQADDEIDGEAARQVLIDYVTPIEGRDTAVELADLAVRPTTSKSAIEEALRRIAPRGSLSSYVEEAMLRIRHAGAVTPGTKTVIKEYTGQPKKLAERRGKS